MKFARVRFPLENECSCSSTYSVRVDKEMELECVVGLESETRVRCCVRVGKVRTEYARALGSVKRTRVCESVRVE